MKQHPQIDLLCNEDGTEIIYNGKPLKIFHTIVKGKKVSRRVNLKCRTVPVARIICECYYGMRDSRNLIPVRADFDSSNDHYTNLSWGRCRNPLKLTTEQEKELVQMARNSCVLKKELLKKFNISYPTLRKILKKYSNENTSKT